MIRIKPLLRLIKLSISSFITILFLPLSKIIKKDSNLVVVLGKKSGFTDNTKYFFIYGAKNYPNLNIVFLTTDKKLVETLSRKKFIAAHLFSREGLRYLFKAKWIVVDESGWPTNTLGVVRGATFYSKKIQLWHGIAIKKIERDNRYNPLIKISSKHKILRKILEPLIKFRYVVYDILLVPAKSQKKIFISAFGVPTKNIVFGMYPRTDFLINPNKYSGWELNIDKKLYEKVKEKSKKKIIITYLPTFRDTQESFFTEDFLAQLSDLARELNLLFLIKPHPLDSTSEKIIEKFIKLKGKNGYILHIPKNEDIYPYLLHTDILITDVSSVLFDFLVLKRPFILFFEDLHRYIKKDREVYQEFFKKVVLKNEVCRSPNELFEKIKETLQTNPTEYIKRSEELIEMLGITFESGTKKILDKIIQQGEK